MPVEIIDTIIPKNGGQFPVVTDNNVAGGFQVQPTTAARDAIPIQNQKVGMLVYVVANTTYYTLTATGSPGTWVVTDLGNNNIPTFFSSLSTSTPLTARQAIFLDGFSTVGDGGGGYLDLFVLPAILETVI